MNLLKETSEEILQDSSLLKGVVLLAVGLLQAVCAGTGAGKVVPCRSPPAAVLESPPGEPGLCSAHAKKLGTDAGEPRGLL